MKKNLVFLLMAFLTLNFTACNDDDDPVYPVDEELAGTYKGTLEIELDGNTIASNLPKNVTIANAGNNAISLELKDFSFMGLNLGTIKIENCALKQVGETYSFTGNQELTLAQPIDKCGVIVEGTIGNGKTKIDLDIDVAALGQKVEVEFNGTKLKGDENSEAKILTFTIDNPIILEQPVIDETTHTITFKVSDEATKEDLSALKPQFTISEKATVSPVSGVAQNFSDGKTVTYTVIAENGTTVEYSVSISMKGQIFGFEDWVAGVEGQEPDMTFYEPVGWASSNTGAHFLKAFSLADSYVVMETNDAHSGEKAALIKSIDTKGQDLYLAKAPKVTTGTLFLGKFITDIAHP